jgi:small-conductance mechanosensitive channel
LYVFAARPFRVGDYVKIGSVEGIVREITLNYRCRTSSRGVTSWNQMRIPR